MVPKSSGPALPIEIWEEIASYAWPRDIPQMRLVNNTLRACCDSSFRACLSTKHTYLSPSSVRNLRDLSSDFDLGNLVKEVNFHPSPRFHEAEELLMKANLPRALRDLRNCETIQVTQEKPVWSKLKNPDNEAPISGQMSNMARTLATVLQALVVGKKSITELKIRPHPNDTLIQGIHPWTLVECGKISNPLVLERALGGITSFSAQLNACLFAQSNAKTLDWCVGRFLKYLVNLKSLELYGGGWGSEGFYKIIGKLDRLNPLSSLQSLKLSNLRLKFDVLLQFLENRKDTLEDVEFEHIALDARRWKTVLEIMGTMPKLKRLKLAHVSEVANIANVKHEDIMLFSADDFLTDPVTEVCSTDIDTMRTNITGLAERLHRVDKDWWCQEVGNSQS
jgi:hypothetical protein